MSLDTMKKAKEIAKKNGFNANQLPVYSINPIYHLIFGTDFIARLAGKGYGWCNRKNRSKEKCQACTKYRAVEQDKPNFCYAGYNHADYHLQKMSTIRDIKKLIEYINTEIMGE